MQWQQSSRRARSGVVASHSAVRDARMNLYPLFYDTSHGVVEKELALGAPSKGGCVMCHSSSAEPDDRSAPRSCNYSAQFRRLL